MGDRPPRLLVAELPADAGSVELPPESVRHARVLRLAVGDRLELFDGTGKVAAGVVTRVERRGIACRVEAPRESPPPSPPLVLLVGLAKGSKLDTIVRMATELGVDALGLIRCERSVADPADGGHKLARLARISLEACAQSGRARPLTLLGPAPLAELAAQAPDGATRLVFWERARAALSPASTPAAPCWAVIGPEGGLSDNEVLLLTNLGYSPVGLGAQILRVETAVPVAAALCLDRMGRLAGP